jgi:RNA polymerase sigma factor (sigma-70 family)
MVLNVCQSVLRHRQEAEDALQATFLILAQKGKSIKHPDCLGSWLHGVARRVSLKARAGLNRRRQAESRPIPGQAAQPAEDVGWKEVQAILHEEIEELPNNWRAAVVLCYLQGLTQDEAARRLGWPTTTLKGRLQQARELLRRRLEGRGLGVASALGATALVCQASANSLPLALKEAAVRTALAGGKAAATTAAGLLASSVLKSSLGTRLAQPDFLPRRKMDGLYPFRGIPGTSSAAPGQARSCAGGGIPVYRLQNLSN